MLKQNWVYDREFVQAEIFHTYLTNYLLWRKLGMPVYSDFFSEICGPFWCKMCGKICGIWRNMRQICKICVIYAALIYRNMRNMRRIHAIFRICGIISAYAISKMQKICDMRKSAKYAIAYAIAW